MLLPADRFSLAFWHPQPPLGPLQWPAIQLSRNQSGRAGHFWDMPIPTFGATWSAAGTLLLTLSTALGHLLISVLDAIISITEKETGAEARAPPPQRAWVTTLNQVT